MMGRKRTWLRALVVPLLVALPVACDDNPTDPGDAADDVAEIRLQVGAQTVRIIDGTPDGPVMIGVGATAISATFRDVAGAVVDGVDTSEFELRIEITGGGVATFVGTGFTGTLTGVAAGTTTGQVSLFHVEEQHSDVGPWTVSIVVE